MGEARTRLKVRSVCFATATRRRSSPLRYMLTSSSCAAQSKEGRNQVYSIDRELMGTQDKITLGVMGCARLTRARAYGPLARYFAREAGAVRTSSIADSGTSAIVSRYDMRKV